MKLFFLTLTAILILFYRPSFTAPFFQDDFELLAGRSEILKPIPDYHYHPLSNQIFYSLSYNIFGNNPTGYHLVLFGVTLASLFLVYGLADDLLGSQIKAFVATIFYAFNVSLFANFYWIATSYFVFGGFFFFLTIWLYLKNTRLTRNLAPLSLVAAFLSNELALVTPAILTLVIWYRKKPLTPLVPVWIVGMILLLFKILVVGFSPEEVYQMHFDGQILATFQWYFLRALNLPEGIRNGARIAIPILAVAFLALLALSIVKTRKINWRLLLFSLGWFVIGAFPFYFLPQHMSAYYLSFALFGVAIFIGDYLGKTRLAMLTVPIYLFLTYLSLDFLSKTHWIILKP